MSFQIPANLPPPSDSGSESDNDDRCSDWGSDLGEALRCQSLFDETVYVTAEEALVGDGKKHGVNVRELGDKLGLDLYGRMRLVNWIRKAKPSSTEVLAIKGDDEKLKDDSLLLPVLADDPLLQLGMDDDWSDDEAAPGPSEPRQAAKPSDNDEVERLRAEVATLRAIVERTIEAEEDPKGKGKARDDDTHYFDSYTHNDIHEIMLKDTARTVSYARFILSNPKVFKDAIVMDVGAGTGILSMFAARAGAKHVYAIEASNIAGKTRENIRANGLADTITVIQGKVENITLPTDTKVDVIISEWMGYMLLYESMLDSVLHARDRFLAPSGLMVPSQTRLVISAITGAKQWADRIDFWHNVYGFDMGDAMAGGYFTEGIVDFVDREEVVTSEAIVRDINSHDATPQSLEFNSEFTIMATAGEEATVRAFLTHFDTFFSPIPGVEGHVAPSQAVHIHEFGNELMSKPVEPVNSAEANTVSFTTGPKGQDTHWKQVSFLLREPITLRPGQNIVGRFFCRKGADNSRELEVEIHFAVVDAGKAPEGYTVQTYKVC